MKPYIEITWAYKNNNRDNPKIKELANKATEHHVRNNRHHPEFYDSDNSSIINKEDRDKSLRLIDGTKMCDINIAEMCVDWQSMSQELNQDNYKKWAYDNVNKRWKFSDKQIKLIYKILDLFK